MLEIFYEDKDILICKKPVGIPTQTPKTGEADMVSMLKTYRASKGEEPYIGLVHRLDQPVSGVMVYAKNKKSAASLSVQMQQGTFSKKYYARIHGHIEPSCGTLEDYLLRDGKTNTSRVVTEGTPNAKLARLHYETISTDETTSLLRVTLDTGRHHQIRIQLAHTSHPLVGDKKYGEDFKGYLPIALCSYHIGFMHPSTKKYMEYEMESPL